MAIFINIALLIIGAAATLSAIGGKTWEPGNQPVLKRVTSRGWVSLTCLSLALALGVTKEFLSKKKAHQSSLTAKLERDALLNQIADLKKSGDQILTDRERSLVNIRVDKALLIERLGQPEKQFDVSGFTCDDENQSYARWSDISGSSIMAIFGDDEKVLGYVIHTSPFSDSDQIPSFEQIMPELFGDSVMEVQTSHYVDSRLAGYAEWKYGAAEYNYMDVWKGWNIYIRQLDALLRIVAYRQNGGSDKPPAMSGVEYGDLREHVSDPNIYWSGVFENLTYSDNCEEKIVTIFDDATSTLASEFTRFDIAVAARTTLITQGYQNFEDWISDQ